MVAKSRKIALPGAGEEQPDQIGFPLISGLPGPCPGFPGAILQELPYYRRPESRVIADFIRYEGSVTRWRAANEGEIPFPANSIRYAPAAAL